MNKLGHLVVMAKEPRIGRVKTRLGRDIGQVAAWNFYRLNLAATLSRLHDRRWHCWLALSPDGAAGNRNEWARGWNIIPQGTGDLGARMMRVFNVPRARSMAGPVVIVGSDIPDIEVDDISCAFAALDHAGMVFGPAADGGYWLVGQRMRPVVINPFNGVRWSGEHALDDTIARALARPAGMRVSFLRMLDDIDNGDDYENYLKRKK